MGGRIKPIGGDFWFDANLFKNDINNISNNGDLVYLDGGQSAIKFIIDNINIKSDEYVLLPSYLCTNIVDIFVKSNVNIIFYNIKSNLEIDLDFLLQQVKKFNVKAIFFIDYFGFYHDYEIIRTLNYLKEEGIILIEDAVQLLWLEHKNEFIGNYVFNSYRKFLPIDGSIVLKNDINKFSDTQNTYDKYYKLVNAARSKKTLFQEFGIGNEYEYLRLFKLAEYEYLNRENVVFEMSDISKKLLSRVDVEYIKNIRHRNFQYVYDSIENNDKIRMIFSKDNIENNIPIGFPILVNNRDNIRRKLMSEFIYCPIHWNIKDNYIPNIFNDAYYLSDSILTLPIDQRYNLEDMNRLVDTLCLYL